jgi:hypothetical protein
VQPLCDWYVDDHAKNVADLQLNTKKRVYLWDRPWNRDYDCLLSKRVYSWDDILEEAQK